MPFFSEFLTTPAETLLSGLRGMGFLAKGVKTHFQRCFFTFGKPNEVDQKLAGVKEHCRLVAVFVFAEEEDQTRLRDAGFFEYEALSDQLDRGPVFIPRLKTSDQDVETFRRKLCEP